MDNKSKLVEVQSRMFELKSEAEELQVKYQSTVKQIKEQLDTAIKPLADEFSKLETERAELVKNIDKVETKKQEVK